MSRKALSFVLAFVMILGFSAYVGAEGTKEAAYPTKAAEFLIPFEAGGSADAMGRALASAAEQYFGQSIVPVNRPGGGGGVMYQALKNSPADGYTIGWNSTSVLTATNIGNVPFGYDAFDHVCRIGYTSMPIAVRADSPYRTIGDLIAAAKRRPGELIIGNAGTGSATHLTAVVFAVKTGIEVTHVPYGAQRRVPALLGGEADAVVVPLPEISAHVQAGEARILAFPTNTRVPGFESVPTLKEEGIDVVIELFRGISAPKGTPPDVLAKLEDSFKKASEDPDFKKIADANGFLIDFMGHEEFEKYLAVQNELIHEGMVAGGLIEK
jgi:tripartite-type tricarboxylate transporter receptor subunit TctC